MHITHMSVASYEYYIFTFKQITKLKLTRVSFDSWLNRFASFASFTISHSSLND